MLFPPPFGVLWLFISLRASLLLSLGMQFCYFDVKVIKPVKRAEIGGR